MPLITVDRDKVSARAEFFLKAGKLVGSKSPYAEYEFDVTEAMALASSEAYYLLNDFYKQKWHVDKDSPTKDSKIAAFKILVIASLCPFKPKKPPEVANLTTTYANPAFALRCACSVMNDFSFYQRPFGYKQRFYNGLLNQEFAPLEAYVAQMKNNERAIFDPFSIDFSKQESVKLQDKINMMETLEKIKSP